MLYLKILQLASFMGNMGDAINHKCTRAQLAIRIPIRLQYENLEIREYYWGERQWDDLPDYANQFDLLMIGGGNFFELWPDTRTGCTIDLPPEIMEKINIPILFYGLGVDPGQGITHPDRFNTFLKYIQETDNRLLVVRNDGANKTLKEHFNSEAIEVPDGGFYYKTRQQKLCHWAINLAGDMLDIRYPNGVGAYLNPLCELLNAKFEQDPLLRLVFIPHIYADLAIIAQALTRINDPYRRTQVIVAPYNMGDMCQFYHCALTLAMRFHANVVSLALGTPTIALNTYPQIENLYTGLGLAQQLANDTDDIEQLLLGFDQSFTLPSIREAHSEIYQWLKPFIQWSG